ncbi:protein CHLOROPLAST IMPORT APPARATUS 2-like isoform X2 [Canna indica]|uniref:Protein CHLOROPLAST IMPORT APPARATUS 2-like isoform X2 n=1 Tax=Canna indica TaxID=4628 RepID=A0AAQ3KDS4_9LILI|nr:protein CHLOROPLAST IMPORT APPARATUS 2-like isoform X2 [Canna indica]
MCVRTRHLSLSFARGFSEGSLERSMAQPLERKRQFPSIINLSLPLYQLGLMDSEVTTTSSSPSSTLSDSSNSPRRISIKKAGAPRKRPNQTYNEAAALLSTIYPNVFSTKSLKRLSKNIIVASFPESSDLLPPLPILSDAAFLIHQAPQ